MRASCSRDASRRALTLFRQTTMKTTSAMTATPPTMPATSGMSSELVDPEPESEPDPDPPPALTCAHDWVKQSRAVSGCASAVDPLGSTAEARAERSRYWLTWPR